MSRNMSNDLEGLFSSFENQLKIHLDQITSKAGTKEKVIQNFDKDLHWQKLGLCFQSVSRECTKLAVGYSKPPEPTLEECKALIGSIAEAIDLLWAWFDAFPISLGRTLSSELEKVVYRLLYAVQEFLLSVKTVGVSESASRLQATGKVWEICDSFSSIAKDNKSAVIKRLIESYQLLGDALTEFEEEINNPDLDFIQNDEEDEETWKEKDRPLFQPCLGLIKAAKRLIKMLKSSVNLKGDINSAGAIDQLDEISDQIDKVSPCVDDLILSLYAPTDHHAVMDNAKLLGGAVECCIQTAKTHHYINEEDTEWIDFICKALNHNLERLSESIDT